MNRLSIAALLMTAAGLSIGEADACLLCRMFGGYGPYGAAPYGSAFYGPSTYTAGYRGGFDAVRPGQIRRANRRAFRRDLFGLPQSYGYFPATNYGGFGTVNYGYAPGFTTGGCDSCGTAAPVIVNSPIVSSPSYVSEGCGCESSYTYPGTIGSASGCPGGDCGANFAPPVGTITPIPADTYGNSSGLPPGARIIDDRASGSSINEPPYSPSRTAPPTSTFERDDTGGSDGAFGPRTDGSGGMGGSDLGSAGGGTTDGDGYDNGGRGFDMFNEPTRGGGPRGNDDLGGDDDLELDSFKPNEELNPASPSESGESEEAKPEETPVKPKRDLDDAAGIAPPTLNLADRPVDSGVQIARSRLRVRANYGLPNRLARRYDLEQGRYGDTRRLAAKP